MNSPEYCPPRPEEAALHWNAVISRYRIADTPRAVSRALLIAGSYVSLWLLMARLPLWPAMLLTIPAGWLLVRVFFILHDCRDGSFFYARAANRLTGFAAGLVTFTPFTSCRWGRRKGRGRESWAEEVEAWLTGHGARVRLASDLAGHAAVRWLAGPLFMVVLQQRRVPRGAPKGERQAVWLMNLALAAMAAGMIFWLGAGRYLLLQTLVLAVAAAAGVALYRAQRAFEDIYWERNHDGEVQPAALERYAYYRLPRLLHWLCGGLGFHRLHGTGRRVPGYHLRRCHARHPLFRSVRGKSLRSSAARAMVHTGQWLQREAKAAVSTMKTATSQMRAVDTAARLAAANRRAATVAAAASPRRPAAA